MSFDMYLWKAPVPNDEREANELLDRHFGGDRSAFQPSPDLKAFYGELAGVVDDLAALGDRTDRLVTLNLLWGTGDDVLADIARLAARHGLVLYDPQADRVHPPDPSGAPAQLPPGEANPAWWRRLFGGGGG
jgi:hypothetical protein